METLYVEYRWGKADAIKYVNGLKPKVRNMQAIIPERGTNAEPTEDQYFKGALMLNTLRTVIDDDAKWFADIHDFYQQFKYQTIMTEDVEAWWSKRALSQGVRMDLTAFFNEYLRHAALPVLELKFDRAKGAVAYRWSADEAGFAMPIKVGDPEHWTEVQPARGEDVKVRWTGAPEDFKVGTDLYYVNVERQVRQ